MKAILSILLVSFVLYTSAEELRLVKRSLPKVCEDALAQDLCVKLREIAQALKLQISKVDDAIVDAAIKGIVSAPAVYRAAKDFLMNEVINKNCEDFLSPPVCTKLRQIAAALKIKAEKVEVFVKAAIMEGVTRGTAIYVKVVDFMKKEVLSKTCVDFLAPRVCDKLKDIAAKLKVEIVKLNEMIIAALVAGYQNKDEIYNNVIVFMKDEVLSTTCEDVLSADYCAKLKAVAAKLKIKAAKVDQAVREAVLKGYLTTSAVVKSVREFFENEVLSKKCEDFLPDAVCTSMKAIAQKMKVRAELVDKAVKDALIKGYNKAQDLADYVKEYLKENINCEDHLSSISCSIIRRTAKFLGVKIQEAEQKIKDLVAQGVTQARELYQKVIAFIKAKILG
eukprot:Seg246.9 transcript_id=Seg246.9/GoldUCD/mRNA.D3Y31 product="hypothetical protein" protein_id=Seg246.9/GoldUCD/D3Y31